ASLRRSLRALLHAEPGDTAQRARRAVAARLPPALRPRRLPLLPRARRPRRPAARPHGDRRGERDHARRRGVAVGAVAMGRLTAVALDALGADLDPAAFAPAFVGALEFEAVPGAVEAVSELTRLGVRLAVVSNWDVALAEHLERIGLARRFEAVVTSAEAGAPKP